jgi:hypothetical protein
MTDKEDNILRILKGDLLRLDDVLACMVARKGMEGIVPSMSDFKIKDLGVWEILHKTMDEFFDIIEAYSEYGLNKVYFELGDYDVMFFILPNTNIALVAIIPALANRGLLEVEVENARRAITKELDKK